MSFAIVLGFPRSGTTLLRQLLDAHDQISCPPEPWLTTAAARFITETPSNGPSIGVLTGLGFSDIPEEDILAPLREMVLAHHRRIADGAPVMVEKSGFDGFYVDQLETLFGGHAKFVCLWRNPLAVAASMRDLEQRMGVIMPELARWRAGADRDVVAYARAWVEVSARLRALAERRAADCLRLTFEDLVSDPQTQLNRVYRFLGVADSARDTLATALSGRAAPGLGDWKVSERSQIDPAAAQGWKRKLNRQEIAEITPILAAEMERLGYVPPKPPKLPDRQATITQLRLMNRMARKPGAS